jgi:hypothetical protein
MRDDAIDWRLGVRACAYASGGMGGTGGILEGCDRLMSVLVVETARPGIVPPPTAGRAPGVGLAMPLAAAPND